jgi:D-tyrosyl-tRNA(Tyr) deacylase
LKAVVQRVKNASVTVEGKNCGSIESGLLVYLGVARGDGKKEAGALAEKIVNLRIFPDGEEKMNLSVKELLENAPAAEKPGIGVLTVSQFTLLADARKGRRPFYGNAADPGEAEVLYEYFIDKIREQSLRCESGVFQAHMKVSYTNDGPVTILLDTKELYLV